MLFVLLLIFSILYSKRSLQAWQQHGRPHSELLASQRDSSKGGSELGGPLRYPADRTLIFWVQCRQVNNIYLIFPHSPIESITILMPLFYFFKSLQIIQFSGEIFIKLSKNLATCFIFLFIYVDEMTCENRYQLMR